jgi:glycosyltransferase involved in cell wall biosynthesis
MVKVADALAEEGYDVSVVSAQFMTWGDEGDRSILASRWSRWRWATVDYRKRDAFPRHAWSVLRRRAARQIMRLGGLERVGFATAARVRERFFPELVTAAVRTRPKLIYGGGNALAATAEAARRAGVPYVLDLEQFQNPQDLRTRYSAVTEKIERRILPGASVLTAGCRAIGEAYRSSFGVEPIPIHNVFPLPEIEPTVRDWDGNLRLYCFGTNIRRGHGLEDAIRAAGLAEIKCELTIRGVISDSYLESLRRLATETAPQLTLTPLGNGPPDDMIDLCRPHDVGLSLEDSGRSLSLSNKAPTYILAGLAVALTETPGQRDLATDLGAGALLCQPGDIESLARGFKKWSDDPLLLARGKESAWAAARDRWHWEHPDERGKLVEAIAGIFQ